MIDKSAIRPNGEGDSKTIIEDGGGRAETRYGKQQAWG
jgi:hypothetical protein